MNARECKRARRAGLSRGRRTWPVLVALGAATMACSMAIGQDDPADVGTWSDPPGPKGPDWDEVVLPDHAVHLFTGRILVWGRDPNGEVPQLWNPRSGDFTPVPNSLHNVSCGGHAALADGSLLVAGGGGESGPASVKTSLFTSTSAPWIPVGNLNKGRWYPTCTTLHDGKVLVVAGSDPSGPPGFAVTTPEIYDPDDETWLALPDNLTPQITRWYPLMFVVPDGNKVFFVGGAGGDGGNGECNLGCHSHILDLDAVPPTWDYVTDRPAPSGPAVIYQTDQGVVEVLKCGGFPGIRATAIIDVTNFTPPPSWDSDFDWELNEGRWLHHNLVILPDGKILVIGGRNAQGYVMDPELFDPNDPLPTWKTLATAQYRHARHSTAVLLADGTVLAAGHDGEPTEPEDSKAEVFSPPYLFLPGPEGDPAPRPKIGFAPTAVAYGTSFSVILSSASPVPREEIAKVSFVRLGATTHGFDQDQRYVPLAVQTDPVQPNGLIVEAPAEGNLAPPGYYMLFLISDTGVPSKAKYVRLIPPPSP